MPTTTSADPCDFVIFGGTGDLAVRKLLPALYLRDRDGQLATDTRIVAVARAGLDEPGYRDKIRAELGRFVAADLLDADTVERFEQAKDRIWAAARAGEAQFWIVYEHGRVERRA